MEIIFMALIIALIGFIILEIIGYRIFVRAVNQFNASASEIRTAFLAASADVIGFNTRLNSIENQVHDLTQDVVTMDIILDLFIKASDIDPLLLAKLRASIQPTEPE